VIGGGSGASCGEGETMISAYCVGEAQAPRISTTTGATCVGDDAKTVIA
jgi:hypothetical protein